MNIEFPTDMREYTYSRRDFLWRNLKLRLPVMLVVIWVFLLLFSLNDFSLTLFLIAGIAGSGLAILLFVWLLRKNLYSSKQFDLPYKFAFTSEYLYFSNHLSQGRYQWEMFNGFREDSKFIGLSMAQGLISLPKQLWSELELEEIRQNLRSKAKPRKIWIQQLEAQQADN